MRDLSSPCPGTHPPLVQAKAGRLSEKADALMTYARKKVDSAKRHERASKVRSHFFWKFFFETGGVRFKGEENSLEGVELQEVFPRMGFRSQET